jgi:hypothetical protein
MHCKGAMQKQAQKGAQVVVRVSRASTSGANPAAPSSPRLVIRSLQRRLLTCCSLLTRCICPRVQHPDAFEMSLQPIIHLVPLVSIPLYISHMHAFMQFCSRHIILFQADIHVRTFQNQRCQLP